MKNDGWRTWKYPLLLSVLIVAGLLMALLGPPVAKQVGCGCLALSLIITLRHSLFR